MLLAPRAPASDLLELNATHVALAVNGVDGARHLSGPRRDAARARVGRGQRPRPRAATGAGSLPPRLLRWARDAGPRGWVRFVDQCRPYDGPDLAYFVAGCKAPDGSYWAIQRWQRNLPHRGFKPWTYWQRGWELRLSHWTGALAQVELYADWAFNGDAHGIFGRMTYAGEPVHGFHTTATGAPTDRYGRSLYIDTHDSPYGTGGGGRRRSCSAIRPGRSVTRSGRRTTSRCRAAGASGREGQPLPDQRRRSRRDARRRRGDPRPRRVGQAEPTKVDWERGG